LNEAYAYANPVLSRGIAIDLGNLTILLISGTASIDEQGRSIHIGDLRAQTRRTFSNIYRPAGVGRRDLARCGAHQLLSAR